MATNYRFVPNAGGMTALATGSEMRDLSNAVAEATKTAAESISPRDTGQYGDSFRVEKNQTVVIDGLPRAGAFVHNDAPYAAAVEFGFRGRKYSPGRSEAHRVLARALGLVGSA